MTPCIRRAWLEIPPTPSTKPGEREAAPGTLALEDEAAGYFCSSLDIGYPEVREVTNAVPDASGTDDFTRLYGSRLVTADVTALRGAGAVLDAVASGFGPYMVLDARPDLHYVLDRPGAPERVIRGMRPASFDAPIAGPFQRDIHLQWLAPDPMIYGPVENVLTVGMPGNGVWPEGGAVTSQGELEVPCRIRIYGPCGPGAHCGFIMYLPPDNRRVLVECVLNGEIASGVAAGTFVEFDTGKQTAVDHYGVSVLPIVDWRYNQWPQLGAGVNLPLTYATPGPTDPASTRVEVRWFDGYMT